MSTKRALLSVYHKEGIVEFAQGLHEEGWKLYGSGNTAKAVQAAGLPIHDVADLVGGAAILGHKVVTLSREVHAGLLADYDGEDLAEMERLGLPYIDLVCVDLYPLQELLETPSADRTLEMVRLKTDIGGPTMLRSAAKGGRIVVCVPERREPILEWIRAGMPEYGLVQLELAVVAEKICGSYSHLSFRLLLELRNLELARTNVQPGTPLAAALGLGD